MERFDPEEHPDLRAGTPLPPTPAAGHLARVAVRLRDDAEDVTDRAVARIRATIGVYEATDVVDRDDLWWSVHRNVELVLRTVADQRPPADEELSVRRELGVRRARQGLPLADLLRAFRVGYLAVWGILTEEAATDGPEAVAELAEQAALVWGMMDAVSSSVADGYRAALEALDVDLRRQVLAFVDALGDGRIADATVQARILGLDPSASIAVAVCRGHDGQLRADGVLVAEQADRTVVLHAVPDGGSEHRLAELLRDHGATHVGTGVAREGSAGAARALNEADLAHRAATALDRATVHFREEWFTCVTVAAADAILPVMEETVRHLRDDAGAMETVEAVLASDGNLTLAAKTLHLHPNGVSYRLGRLQERTGLDLRTSAGVRDASVALVLARRQG